MRLIGDTDYTKGDYNLYTCSTATTINKFKGQCLKDCPFKDCILDLTIHERKILMNQKKVMNVLECVNCGMKENQISTLFNDISRETIQYWIRNAKRIQEIVTGYGIAEN